MKAKKKFEFLTQKDEQEIERVANMGFHEEQKRKIESASNAIQSQEKSNRDLCREIYFNYTRISMLARCSPLAFMQAIEKRSKDKPNSVTIAIVRDEKKEARSFVVTAIMPIAVGHTILLQRIFCNRNSFRLLNQLLRGETLTLKFPKGEK